MDLGELIVSFGMRFTVASICCILMSYYWSFIFVNGLYIDHTFVLGCREYSLSTVNLLWLFVKILKVR